MPKPQDPSRKKGSFGPIRLPVTKGLVFPARHQTLFAIGGSMAGAVALFFLFDSFVLNDTFSSPGPLSSNHAIIESECSNCHETVTGITSPKCSTCHEKTNDPLGVYSYSAHYLYRSEDPRHIRAGRERTANKEGSCAECHAEHRGREAELAAVSDRKCVECHDFDSFESHHPEFAFARESLPDDSTLAFTHVRHARFVYDRLQKQGTGVYLEKTCLYCHNPQPDGRTFKPLDFETHCGDCHLTTTARTPNLVIRDPQNPDAPGVETLAMIQQRRGPGTLWAFYTNPNEFTVSPRGIVKSPVYHRDPWIMENLRQLNQRLYGSASALAGLIPVRRGGTSGSQQTVYAQAISILKEYAVGLRSRPEPEVQKQLGTIDSLLRVAERRVLVPTAVLPMELFLSGKPDAGLTVNQQLELMEFAQKITEPCRVCHSVEGAGILSVKSSQRTLLRAEFDHRAHVLERRCLECHTDIPVEQSLIKGDTTGVRTADRASTQNIPRIANCRECHGASKVSDSCTTCHFMHPNKKDRGTLQLTIEKN